ncbi:aldose 1-epimerase family protein [Nocardioides ferulae]|uniref:aldose 1-epimerase family protein n=1 Tax=Nocardioides ferulae TaxID=2340821 RepID=UPI001F0C81E0|nr:aldose 1-epimerase family protein [Nocardioides ferulae]
MLSPTGEQVELAYGELSATLTEVGASLRRLQHRGHDLVRGFGADEIAPAFSGAVLAPWPNRVRDGRYRFAGREHQLALSEPERHTALHGLVLWEAWSLLDRSTCSVTWGHRLFPRPGYPFRLDLEATYTLGEQGLRLDLAATNVGADAAPYGCSIHPYLVAGPGTVDDWTLHLPAATVLDVDPERLLPTGRRPAGELGLDFTEPRVLGPIFADHAFTDLERDSRGRARATLLTHDGSGVAMEWGPELPWVQVHTADRPEPALNRTGLALEPMSCPPDALSSGEDLVVLRPGERHSAWWVIAPVLP